MPQISLEQVERVAALARLGLTKKEAAKAAQDLDNILAHFAVIQKIDTSDVLTSDDVTGLKNVTRQDEVGEQICSQEELLKAAPAVKDRQVKVPGVFR